jgi:hypothetical protein
MVFGEENPFSDFFDNFDIKTLHESKEIVCHFSLKNLIKIY